MLKYTRAVTLYAALLLVAMFFVAAAVDDKFSIRVSRPKIYAGQETTVVCHVPPNEDNREIEGGITMMTSSTRDVRPDSLPNFRFEFKEIPCDVGPAFCVLRDNAGRQRMITAPFEVINCSQQ